MLWRLALQCLLILSPRFIPRLFRIMHLVWKLTFDRRVPFLLRALVPVALVYFVAPIGILSDFLPFGIGLIEDVAFLILAIWALITFAPQHVVEEHAPWKVSGGPSRSSPRPDPSKVVDSTTFHVVDEEDRTQ